MYYEKIDWPVKQDIWKVYLGRTLLQIAYFPKGKTAKDVKEALLTKGFSPNIRVCLTVAMPNNKYP